MNHRRHNVAIQRAIWISLLLLAALPGLSQQAAPAPPRKTSTPYSGDLSIFDSPGREQRLHINEVMDALGIESGKNVADIGAGSGWFTMRAAKRINPGGTVYAVDINPEAIQYINQRADKEKTANVHTVLSKPDNAGLPDNTIDAVLLLKTYHEVVDPVALMRNLRPSLRSGAHVGIIDRKGNGENHGIQKDVVVREMEQAGYGLVAEKDKLVTDDNMDYFLIFTIK